MFIATTISFVDILNYNATNNIGLDLEGDYCFDSEYYGCVYWVTTTESDLLDTVSKNLIEYMDEHFDDGRELDEHKITIYVLVTLSRIASTLSLSLIRIVTIRRSCNV